MLPNQLFWEALPQPHSEADSSMPREHPGEDSELLHDRMQQLIASVVASARNP